MNHVTRHGSLLLRVMARRWKRALLLPETILIAGLLVVGGFVADHTQISAGQPAMASVNGIVQDGVPSPGAKRKQRGLQEKLRGNPAALMALTSADMMTAFGYADLHRQEGAVTLMQFRGESCVLDVYANDHGAMHYEFRTRQQGRDRMKVRPQQCIDDILESRRV